MKALQAMKAICRRHQGARNESGAILVLALMFLTISAGLIGGLAAWTGNDLTDIGHLKSTRQIAYAADGAVQTAIYNLRFGYQASSSGSGEFCQNPTLGSTTPITLNGQSIDVWCQITNDPAGFRFVTLQAYPSSQCGSTCSNNPYITAMVTFDDGIISSTGTESDECTSSTVTTSCGLGMQITSWVVQPGLTTV